MGDLPAVMLNLIFLCVSCFISMPINHMPSDVTVHLHVSDHRPQLIYHRSSKNSAPLIFRYPNAMFRQGSSDLYALYGVHARAWLDVEISHFDLSKYLAKHKT